MRALRVVVLTHMPRALGSTAVQAVLPVSLLWVAAAAVVLGKAVHVVGRPVVINVTLVRRGTTAAVVVAIQVAYVRAAYQASLSLKRGCTTRNVRVVQMRRIH